MAGPAIVTHLATGRLATTTYTRSGQLRAAQTRRIALIPAGAAVLGTPMGVPSNGLV